MHASSPVFQGGDLNDAPGPAQLGRDSKQVPLTELLAFVVLTMHPAATGTNSRGNRHAPLLLKGCSHRQHVFACAR
jgi:hypothetical protein